jgi:fatty acid desaturase
MTFALSRDMELHPVSFYVHELKRHLPTMVFRPAPGRLLWLLIHLAVIGFGSFVVADQWVPWWCAPLVSVPIGLSVAGLMFLGHETLHGGVVRGRWRWLTPIVGWICFAPFLLSQQLWVTWHNRAHHSNTNKFDLDPDMYPTLEVYRREQKIRWSINYFALGGGRKRGVVSLLIGFMIQSKSMLLYCRKRFAMSNAEYRRTVVETLLAVALWVTVGVIVGPLAMVFILVIPLVIADTIVMAFILTNHCLSPATEINDPMINALTVNSSGWLEWLTLQFGYHVEHHLFPSVSGRHAQTIRRQLCSQWPERYQSMPLGQALSVLYHAGRVYKDATTLIDPLSGGEWPTLRPRTIESRESKGLAS